jgi:hypothetical protein
MRAILVASALIVIQVGSFASPAHAQCDQFCTVIKRALDDQKSNFQSLKGNQRGDVSSAWMANISPPGMWCSINYRHDYSPTSQHPRAEPYWTFYCSDNDTEQHQADFKKHFNGVFGAFRQLEPKWKWFKSSGELGSTDYYGGPAGNELYASVGYTEFEGAGTMSFVLHSTPIYVYVAGLKPYRP